MEVQVINGADLSAQQATGLSRVTPTMSFENEPLNGFSRVNLNGNYTLNGEYMFNGDYQLNGAIESATTDEQADFLLAIIERDPDAINGCTSLNGWRDWLEKRKEKKAARQERRTARKDVRAEKRELRKQKVAARLERIKSGEGGISKILDTAKNIFGQGGDPMAMLEEMPYDETAGDLSDILASMDADAEKGYLLGKPPFEPWTGKWWSAKRVPTWQKAAVAVGGVLILDQVANKGKLLKKITGKKR
jgi:hypothetical protein